MQSKETFAKLKSGTRIADKDNVTAGFDPLSSLKEISDLCHHIRGAAKDLIAETQRVDLAVIGQQNYLPPNVVPDDPQPAGSFPLGTFIPARKKWVNYFMSHINFLVPELQNQINDLAASKSMSNSAELITDIQYEMNNLQKYYTKLSQETQTAPYVNLAIASDAQGLSTIAARIEKDQKDLEKQAKRDDKKR
jgi:hypothetical protein